MVRPLSTAALAGWAALTLAASACGGRPETAPADVCDAVRAGNVAYVGALLDGGLSPDAVATDPRTARAYPLLAVAARTGQAGAVRLLIARGARVRARGEHGSTALHEAAESADTAVVRLLLDRGADPDVLGEADGTPLGLARSLRLDAIAALLVAAGATR